MSESSTEIRYSLSAWSVARAILVVFLFVLLFEIKDILLAILTSIVVASATQPFVGWLMRKARFPRVLSVIFVYLAVLLVLGGLLFAFVPPIADEMVQLSSTLPLKIAKLPFLEEGFRGSIAGERISNYLAQQLESSDFFGSFGQAIKGVGGSALGAAGKVFGGLFTIIFVIVLSFYFAVQERGVENFLRLVVPQKHEDYAISLWTRAEHKIGLWIQGQLLLAVIIGVFVFLGLTIFGVGFALLLALWAAVM